METDYRVRIQIREFLEKITVRVKTIHLLHTSHSNLPFVITLDPGSNQMIKNVTWVEKSNKQPDNLKIEKKPYGRRTGSLGGCRGSKNSYRSTLSTNTDCGD